ncbi:MAG: hypothetical protein OMM_07287 [Candidatus Magnetoglobus multicellularis str. Araruama]|uniref:Uncharacterized protein n=1 Tax=Candidatus Magnetoglobus multicellularis str. Araruama TaxID=890399 RepID=A0A1V1PDM0_9BACT|nr:MAG: hypothetical protein OMM_07287 [Candidatus Magnetoglobus multicellularis str. Araruama]
MHKTTKMIIDYALENNIATIVIGKNDGWKQEIEIGKRNNQNFVQIPFNKLIEQVEYKSEEEGITVKSQEVTRLMLIILLMKQLNTMINTWGNV